MTIYKGFSTYNRVRKFNITDFELIKQDIFNHFSIRKGEKLMNPKFGSIVWDLMFDPLTERVQELISEDIKVIIDSDPRVIADRVVVTEYNQGFQIEIDLKYVLTNQVQTMILKFDRDTKTLTMA